MTWVTEPTNYPYYGLITISYGSFDYLHHTRTDPDDRLYQEIRALPDFEKAWLRERRTIFRRPGKGANTPYLKFYLCSVEENRDSLSVVLACFEQDAEEG